MADYKNAAPPSYPQDSQYPPQHQPSNQHGQSEAPYAPDSIQHPAPGQAAIQHQDSSFTQEKSAPLGSGPPSGAPIPGQQQMMNGGYQTAVPISALTSAAAPIDCPACNMRQMTRVEFHSGGTTWAWAAGACCLLSLGCIPFCISATKDVQHSCGHCGARVATWHRSGRTEVLLHR